ncbi:MAG: acetyl-CoA carboxylase biotin carboxyl carrier protein [Nocardioidaceae bacterium]
MSELSFAEVGEILQLVQSIDGADVHVEWGDLRIHVRRGVDGNSPQPAAPPAIADAAISSTEAAQQPEPATAPTVPTAPTPTQPTSTPSTTTDALDVPEHWVAVTAPLAGTVYRAPRPDASPFVEVGDTVAPEDTVALVEVMKLFTELKAEVSGKVARIEAEDSSLVEFGQNLIWIEPA